jgi:hypothetical protein
MHVMMPREKWTDERLDELSRKMDAGFDRVDKDIRELRIEMNDGFRSLNRSLLAGAIVIVATLIGTTGSLAGIALL